MALSSLISGLRTSLLDYERRFILGIFGRQFPPPALLVAEGRASTSDLGNTEKSRSLKEILQDAFLYAVPKSRRSLEKRMKRKFGSPSTIPKGFCKLIPIKKHIRTCPICGNNFRLGQLCPHCYEKVFTETMAMQEKITAVLGHEAVESEVVVLYEGEKEQKPDEFWKGKRIVEMEKSRPPWFSKNLLQKTTQQPATSTDVKPTDLA